MKKIVILLTCFLTIQMQALENDGQTCVTNEKSHDITIEIKINCPMSEELRDFVKSIPSGGNYSTNFDEWKSSFINNMTQLIHLVESEKILNSSWSVKTDLLPQEVEE